MKRQSYNIRHSSMFLIELIIAILFLSLCSAICIRLFVNARLAENNSYNITQAVTVAQNIAEVFEARVSEASQSSIDDNFLPEYTIYYDNNFLKCDKENAVFSADICISCSEYLISADIIIAKASDTVNSNSIYSLHVDHAVSTLGGL